MFDSVKISLSLTKGICHFSYFRGSLLPADSERLTRFKAALHLAVVTPPPHPLALIPDVRGLLHSERTARFPVPGGRVSPPRAPYCPCQPSLVEAWIPVGARTARAGTPRTWGCNTWAPGRRCPSVCGPWGAPAPSPVVGIR